MKDKKAFSSVTVTHLCCNSYVDIIVLLAPLLHAPFLSFLVKVYFVSRSGNLCIASMVKKMWKGRRIIGERMGNIDSIISLTNFIFHVTFSRRKNIVFDKFFIKRYGYNFYICMDNQESFVIILSFLSPLQL